MDDERVTIDLAEYRRLKADSRLVLAMDSLKVWKHWDGYEDAVEIAERSEES